MKKNVFLCIYWFSEMSKVLEPNRLFVCTAHRDSFGLDPHSQPTFYPLSLIHQVWILTSLQQIRASMEAQW